MVWRASAVAVCAVLVSAASAAACKTDLDCSLNGICGPRAVCHCDTPWTGTDCGTLLTRPAGVRTYGYEAQGYWPNETAKTSSWGGNILPGAANDQSWHLWVAEIPEGLANWGSRSRCVHAVASSMQGPYKKSGVVMPAECHNPEVIRDRSTGTGYLLAHIGHGAAASPLAKSSWLARAVVPGGPFTPLNTSAVDPHRHGCNNPAPAFHPNGTLFVVCNQFQLTSIHPDALRRDTGEWTPLRSSGLDAPKPEDGRHWEDAFLWFDSRGHWHILYHCYCLEPFAAHNECFSGHGYSINGTKWTFSGTEPFGGRVRFADGTATTFTTRERPKLVFGGPQHTVPIGLVTGVSAACSPPSAACCARCNRSTTGAPTPPTCSQCKHGWQHCEGGHCYGGSKGGMDYTYTVFEPLGGVNPASHTGGEGNHVV